MSDPLMQALRALEKELRKESDDFERDGDEDSAAAYYNCAERLSDVLDLLTTRQEVAPVALIEAARDWIAKAQHGDNCYLDPDHAYGNACYCGKESILAALESTGQASDARDVKVAELIAAADVLNTGAKLGLSTYSEDWKRLDSAIAAMQEAGK